MLGPMILVLIDSPVPRPVPLRTALAGAGFVQQSLQSSSCRPELEDTGHSHHGTGNCYMRQYSTVTVLMPSDGRSVSEA